MSQNIQSYFVRMETLKLLLQAAWADHEVQDAEASAITRAAQALELDPTFEAQIRDYLTGRVALPAPDLGLLRAHKQEVVDVVKQLLAVDQQWLPGESELLAQLEELLA